MLIDCRDYAVVGWLLVSGSLGAGICGFVSPSCSDRSGLLILCRPTPGSFIAPR